MQEKMMRDDLISRQAAIDALKHNQNVYSHNFHDDPIDKYTSAIIAADIDSLVNLPSVQPEIIRCKDCKFWKKYGYINGKPEFLPKCGFNQIYTSKDDFCSRAER